MCDALLEGSARVAMLLRFKVRRVSEAPCAPNRGGEAVVEKAIQMLGLNTGVEVKGRAIDCLPRPTDRDRGNVE